MEIYTDRPKWWKSQAFRSLGPGAVLPPMDMTPGHVCDGMIQCQVRYWMDPRAVPRDDP